MSSWNINEKVDILFKKTNFNTTSLNIDKEYYEERIDLNRRRVILPEQIWSNGIPGTAPTLEYTEELALGITNPIPGESSPVDYSYIKKYIKIDTEHVYGSNNTSYYSSSLINTIDFLHDPSGSYMGKLYRNDGVTEIPFGTEGGNWILDYSSGIITFHDYDKVSGFVDENNPPKITFWKYEGNYGLDPGVTSPTTAITTFNGGNSSGSGDDIHSIIVDDRFVGNFLTSNYSRSIQLGGDYEGSWRIVVRGGGSGTPSNSSLELQKRSATPNVWTTIHSFI